MPNRRVGRAASDPVIDLTIDDLEIPTTPKTTVRKRKTSGSSGSESKNKKAKKEKEKRIGKNGNQVRTSPQPSQGILQRIERALPGSGHRLFLIQRGGLVYDEDNCPKEEFSVLGATGNVYTVEISKQPCCSCPDNEQRGNICKHILFILLRVLKVPRDNQIVWQKAYLTEEVFEIFEFSGGLGDNKVGGDVQAPQSVVNAFNAEQRGEQIGENQQVNEDGRRRKVEGDCPICFDELVEGGEELVWCRTCGNNLHKGCFVRWQQQKRGAATCVYCRSHWHEEVNNDDNNGGYVNLAQFSAEHRNADTSLEALYGDDAIWIYAQQGRIGRTTAARMHRATHHR
eukprot:TRINITY_DN45013_c0_g1_i2.p1 TRINITY_DN45013_c0_g1~~TRINITY_DN45013_c0_g1_i2.p1  ORF type:complete len:355 (-),score=56.13 TRINITY_DN45013_c0_g1_i2:209-1234(-)